MQSIIVPDMPPSVNFQLFLASLRVYFTFGRQNRPLFFTQISLRKNENKVVDRDFIVI